MRFIINTQTYVRIYQSQIVHTLRKSRLEKKNSLTTYYLKRGLVHIIYARGDQNVYLELKQYDSSYPITHSDLFVNTFVPNQYFWFSTR